MIKSKQLLELFLFSTYRISIPIFDQQIYTRVTIFKLTWMNQSPY